MNDSYAVLNSHVCLIHNCTAGRRPWFSCSMVGCHWEWVDGWRCRQGGGGSWEDVRLEQDRIKTERGEHWWWPCTFHLQALIKPSQASIDFSQNNPFRLSVPGHVGHLQLFIAECCASFRWDATMCPGKRGKPVNCRLQDSKGDTVGGKGEMAEEKRGLVGERFEVGQRKLRIKWEREIRHWGEGVMRKIGSTYCRD